MTNIINEDIIRKILNFDHSNNEVKILKWDINKNIVGTGSNFASEVSRLTVTYERNRIQIQKAFFMKVPCNSVAYEDFNRAEVYDKEIVMYSKVFPQMYAIDDEYFTPRNYFVDGKKSLFQKDLSLSGYKMMNNLDQLNLEQSLYALKCLAKFHGLSVKVEGALGFPDVVKRNARCYPMDKNKRREEIDGFYQSIKEFDKSLPNDIKERYPKQVAAFSNITWEQYEHDVSPRCDSFNVLIHGDFWTNNILFKCDKFGILKKVKVVDFQLCAWTNPSIDFIYFMITSVQFEVYEKYFDLLLNVYLDTLNKVLDKLNCRKYRMEELVKDIETRYIYSCYVIIEALPFTVCDPEDPIELDDLTVSPFSKIYAQRFYREVAMKWLLHLIQKGVFDGEAVNGRNLKK